MLFSTTWFVERAGFADFILKKQSYKILPLLPQLGQMSCA